MLVYSEMENSGKLWIDFPINRAFVPGSSSSCQDGAAAQAWLPSPMVEKPRGSCDQGQFYFK